MRNTFFPRFLALATFGLKAENNYWFLFKRLFLKVRIVKDYYRFSSFGSRSLGIMFCYHFPSNRFYNWGLERNQTLYATNKILTFLLQIIMLSWNSKRKCFHSNNKFVLRRRIWTFCASAVRKPFSSCFF